MRSLITCLIVLLFHQSALSATDDGGVGVRDWLQQMVNAVHTLSYEGTFVYLHNNQLESMRIEHNAATGEEKERLLSLNGVPREVIRDSASVTCIAPDAKSVSIGNRTNGGHLKTVFSADLERLSHFYDFHSLGDARVANRAAIVVAIVPRDAYRYGYRIYIDKQHALPLKTDMLDSAGSALSQLMFTQLKVQSDGSVMEDINLEGKENYRWELQKPIRTIQNKNASNWAFTKLPDGFRVTLHSKRKGARSNKGIDHFVLSDGIASLSVYIEQAAEDDLKGASTMGTINAYGSELDGYQITAVGEVPAMTVQQVATSIKRIE